VSDSDITHISGRCVEFARKLTQGGTVDRIKKQPLLGLYPYLGSEQTNEHAGTVRFLNTKLERIMSHFLHDRLGMSARPP
jgi:hypothetical protein